MPALAVNPVAWGPVAGLLRDDPTPAGFVATVEDPLARLVFLAEIEAFKGGVPAQANLMGPVAGGPLAAIAQAGPSGDGLVTIRAADRGWIGEPADSTWPNTIYEPRLAVPLVLEREIPILPETDRRGSVSYGAVELVNADGGLDDYVNSYAVNGRPVRILLGPGPAADGTPADYAAFSTVAKVVGDQWASDLGRLRITVRDQGFRLEGPLQTTLYGGTGGADGNAEVQGRPKPLALGIVRNVTPVLIDTANAVFQVNDGPVLAIDAVRDQGLALTPGADYPDHAALVAAAVAPGTFATCLAGGYFRLGTFPTAGLLTADLRGDANGGYVDTHGAVAKRLLTQRAGIALAELDVGSFDSWPSGAMGLYAADPISTAQVLDDLAASVGGWWVTRQDGRIGAGRLSEPATRSPALVLDQTNIRAIDPLDLPALPRWRQRVGYQRNWTVQRGEDINASVGAALRQFLLAAWRVQTQADATVQSRYPLAPDPPPLPTFFDGVGDAGALCDALMDLHSPTRQAFAVTIGASGHLVDLNDAVRLAWPRWGLSAGKTFAIFGHRIDGDRGTVTLKLWG